MGLQYPKHTQHRRLCRIATGSYTGDGTVSQAITGIGFQPKFLLIAPDVTAETTSISKQVNLKFEGQNDGLCISDLLRDIYDNLIETLDTDGFTVGDEGLDNHPNKNGQAYIYIVFA